MDLIDLRQSYPALKDQVSIDYGSENLCGNVKYTLMNYMLSSAPEIVKVEHTSLEPTFTIVIETKTYNFPNTFRLILRGQLENYADSVPLDQDFTLEIEKSNSFVFVPPSPHNDDHESQELEKPPIIPEEIINPEIP